MHKNNCFEHLNQHIKEMDWNCLEADTKYFTHSIHRYSGKFIPQIAANAIQILTTSGDLVLDPYCGSGTTLLEASIHGRRSVGIDLNPIACLISRVKVMKVSKTKILDLEKFWTWALGHFVDLTNYNLLEDKNFKDSTLKNVKSDSRLFEDWYTKWFNEKNLFQLLIISNIINTLSGKKKEISLLAFSDILRRSSNAHSGYPNVMFDRNRINNNEPIKLFLKRLPQVTKALTEVSNKIEITPKVITGDAGNMKMEDSSVDAVITHPPYIGSIPYAEYGMLSLEWLGYNFRDLDRQLCGGRRQSKDVVDRFEVDFNNMITESYRVLKKNKFMFLQLGNPTVRGETINLENLAMRLALACGFEHSTTHYRTGINRRANKMGKESLMFFLK